MYRQTAQTVRRTRTASRSAQRRGSRERQEGTRLTQLLICLVLFLVMCIGKGVFPRKMLQVRDHVLSLITADTDFRAALDQLGTSLSDSGVGLDELSTFCMEVFGGGEEEKEPPAQLDQPLPRLEGALKEELHFLGGNPSQQELSAHYLPTKGPVQLPQGVPAGPPAESQVSGEPATVPAVGTVVFTPDYTGEPLPDNYTMDCLSLGELETVTPLMGHLNSEYCYRDHPLNGKYLFHGGVDIGGQTGDAIGAFADGKVDYIGKNDSYGLYLQLDHGNGIKSFYAHCSKLCVSKGELVAAGEKVAEVGSTGMATGPHLHLELKYNGKHLNPAYYVEFLPDR